MIQETVPGATSVTTVATTARTTTYHVDCCCPGDGWQTGDEGQKGHQNEDAAVSHF